MPDQYKVQKKFKYEVKKGQNTSFLEKQLSGLFHENFSEKDFILEIKILEKIGE